EDFAGARPGDGDLLDRRQRAGRGEDGGFHGASSLERPAPLRRPALDHDLLVGVELDRVATLAVQVAEETPLPPAEREARDGRGDAEVDPDVSGLHLVAELPRGGPARREEAGLVPERGAIDEVDRLVDRADAEEAEHRAKDLGPRERALGRDVGKDR